MSANALQYLSSLRKQGPIRCGLAFVTLANGFCSNERRWLWVPAFAGTTLRDCAPASTRR
jgi:hypothetical protein